MNPHEDFVRFGQGSSEHGAGYAHESLLVEAGLGLVEPVLVEERPF